MGDNVSAAFLAVIHGPVRHFQKFQFGFSVFRVTGKTETGGKVYLKIFIEDKGMGFQ